MARSLLLIIGLALGLSSCQSSEPPAIPPDPPLQLDSLIVGTWESVSLKVEIPTANNADSTLNLVVPNGKWEEKLGIKPIHTTYAENNTYRSEYFNLDDSLIRTTRGIWNTFSDTLLLIEADATYEYICRYREPFMEFKSIMDWDGDGEMDDIYEGVQQRVKTIE